MADQSGQSGHSAKTAMNALALHVWVPENVKVTVEKGWVTLTGEVAWGYQKEAASDALRFLPGVRGIDNLILIKPRVEATAIAASIEHALERTTVEDAKRIKVFADGSRVRTPKCPPAALRESICLSTRTLLGASD